MDCRIVAPPFTKIRVTKSSPAMALFSKRTVPKPDTLRYDVSPKVRARIYHTLNQLGQQFETQFSFRSVLGAVGNRVLAEEGTLSEAAGVHTG
jgi:hypothetical protein